MLVSNNAEIAYQSCNYILLNPGFTSESGSKFSAIVTDLATDADQIDMPDKLLLGTIEKDKSAAVQCYPNPNHGIFTIKNNADLTFEQIDIFTTTGQKCQSSFSISNSNVIVSIATPANGFYIVKLTTTHGEILFQKVLIMN